MFNKDYLWHSPPALLELPIENIHIWKANLDRSESFVKQMEKSLSDDELSRAKKYHFSRDAEHFIVSRGILRKILSLYLKIKPDQLEFQYGAYGKPYLTENLNKNTIQFNIAHSHSLAVYAFALDVQLGIDVEYICRTPGAEDIFARFFSTYENSVFQKLPMEQRQWAFFRCWTLKEAFIKATGEGLAYPLNQFDVAFAPGEPARLLNIAGNSEEAFQWILKDFTPDSGYISAIALKVKKNSRWNLEFWEWNSDQ
jgi:4'-phosphopantetheinyl transferase